MLGMEKLVEYSPVSDIPFMHPGRTAEVSVNGKSFGYLGEIHPTTAENYNIGTRVYVAVIDMATLVENANLVNIYVPLPKFPAVTRDIAMLVKDEVIVKEIENVIRKKGGKLLESMNLFDVYKGSQIADGYKSVAYSITFRAPDRTLVDDDVNAAMNKILDGLKNELGAELRDR